MKPFLTGRAQHDQPSLARDVTSGGGLASLNKTGGSEAGGAGNAVGNLSAYPHTRGLGKPSALAANAHARASGHAHDHQGSGGGGAPSVECIKQGDKVVRLIVTCSCGERIEIDCLYPSAS